MTEQELRQFVVNIMVGWLGRNEANGTHKVIIDLYNNHKPLARNYKMGYDDPWCATTISAAFIKAGLTDIAPTECGCGEMVKLYQAMGRFVEADDYVPKKGDIVMYDWQDSGVGDNTGWPDHVGMVVSVDGNKMKIIEGNLNDHVAYRTIEVNGKNIRGYCCPDYASKATKDQPSDWAVAAWEKAVSKGIFDGTMPQAPLTREQAAVVLDRLGLLD